MAKKYVITHYPQLSEASQVDKDDAFLVARQSSSEYFSMPWSVILNQFELKADAYNDVEHPLPLETYGLVQVKADGIVTGVRSIEPEDLPKGISSDKIDFDLETQPDSFYPNYSSSSSIVTLSQLLLRKVDYSFAEATNYYVIGKYEFKKPEEEAGSGQKNSYVKIYTTKVSTLATYDEQGNRIYENVSEFKKVGSKDGSIEYEVDEEGNLYLQVNPEVASVQSDWAETDSTKKDYIKNKPELATVATTGDYNDLSNKLEFESEDLTTLTINKDPETNKYYFNALSKSLWGSINGELTDQTDLMAKFAAYYTSTQVDELLKNISSGVLHVKGCISSSDPSLVPGVTLKEGYLWFESYSESAPVSQQFTCYSYNPNKAVKWNEVSYTATDFDVWTNNNITGDPAIYFWLGTKWEQLDFSIDLTKYYTKDQIDTKLAGKQDTLSGTAGNVVTYTETAGEVTETRLAKVATTGNYKDLDDIAISDWNQSDSTKLDYIKNKPELATVATTGSYNDLLDKPDVEQSDWRENDPSKASYIKNKPESVVLNVSITSICLTHLNYDFSDHSYYINLEDVPDDEFHHEVFWNGVLQRDNVEYVLNYGGTFFDSEDIVEDMELSSLIVSTRNLQKVSRNLMGEQQGNWRITLEKLPDESNLTRSRAVDTYTLIIDSNTSSNTIKIYKDMELVETLYVGTDEPDYMEHQIYANQDSFKLTEVIGTPNNDTVGLLTHYRLYMLGNSFPEEADINDIMTVKFFEKLTY